MPTFTYTARDQEGLVQNGHLDASTEDEVIAVLQHRGLLVTAITQKGAAAVDGRPGRVSQPGIRTHKRVTVQDQVLLCQQLATLVDAGLPLLKSLEVVSSQTESHVLKRALEDARHDVAAGRTFKDALAKHPDVFSPMWLNLIETGEASGHLADSLFQLARHFELSRHIQEEAKTALTYPAFLLAGAALVVILFVYWLIPKFSSMFASMDIDLPLITRLVVGFSEGARRFWWLVLGIAVVTAYVLRMYLRTTAGKWTRDQLLLRLPLFQTFFANLQVLEFSRGLSTLLGSGVPLLSSLEILERSATNKVYGKAIGSVRESVKEGKSMAAPMQDTGLFPPLALQMVQVGEEVGELAKMSDRIAKFYEEQVERFIARLTRLFEPIVIVVMGGLVLIIVLSIFMPIFQMATSIKATS